MRTITLPVNDHAAEGYDNAAPKEKAVINAAVDLLLEEFLRKQQNDDLFALMDKASEEAQKNGLTIEKLSEIMEWDADTVKNLFGEHAG